MVRWKQENSFENIREAALQPAATSTQKNLLLDLTMVVHPWLIVNAPIDSVWNFNVDKMGSRNPIG